MNLTDVVDIENKIEKDVILAFDTVKKTISGSDLKEFIEKNSDKNKENISHLILGAENCESGNKYNEKTFEYLRDILDTRIDKKSFDLIDELTNFFEENYRLYLQFKQKNDKKVSLKLDKQTSCLKISSENTYEITNPLFNSLGNIVTNPPFEIYEKKHQYICFIELPDVDKRTIKLSIEKKKTEFNCLYVTGIKNYCKFSDEDDNENVVGTRSYGEFRCVIPLGPNYMRLSIITESICYKNGIFRVDVKIFEEEEEII